MKICQVYCDVLCVCILLWLTKVAKCQSCSKLRLILGNICEWCTSFKATKDLKMSELVEVEEPIIQYDADINKYFERTGYSGSRDTSLETLRDIVWCHQKTFPFENLNVHLNRRIVIDLKLIEDKFVHQRRGGYCFEHTTLLINILKQIGFQTLPMIARVVAPTGVKTASTHGVIKVHCEDKIWLVDCGFGPYGSTVPLEITDSAKEFPTKVYPHRVFRDGDVYIHQAKSNEHLGNPNNEWENLYTFKLDEAFPEDYNMGSWYCSTYPDSFFVKNIVVSKFWPDKRCILFNKRFKYRAIGDDVSPDNIEVREIETQEEYLRVLREYFDLSFPEGTVLCPPGLAW